MAWRQAHPRLWVAFKILLCLAGLVLALFLSLLAYVSSDSFKHDAADYISEKSGRKVIVDGEIDARWGTGWTPHVKIRQLEIGNAEWAKKPIMFRVDELEMAIFLPDLLRGRINFPQLTLTNPQLFLEKDKQGNGNWEFSENPEAELVKGPLPDERSEMPIIGQLQISGGKLEYSDSVAGIKTALDISTVQGEAKANERLVIEGKGEYRNAPFTLRMEGDSILSLQAGDEPYPFLLQTSIGGTRAKVEGRVDDPVTLEGLNVALDLKGQNAAELFPITGIALPPTPAYHITGRLVRDDEKWSFNKFKGTVGESDLSGSLQWFSEREQPYLKADFISQNLDMKDLGGLIGADEEADGGRVIPDTPLDISRLRAMDADVTLQGKRIKTTDILEDFSMNLKLRKGVLEVIPVRFGIAGGSVSANLYIDGRKYMPHTTMDVDFKRLSLNELFQPLVEQYGQDNVSAGMLGGKASFEGDGKSLREMLGSSDGELSIGMEGGKLSRLLLELAGLDIFKSLGLVVTGSDTPVDIRCVVGDFGVTDGMMKSRVALIDTAVTTLEGEGAINLKNERMAMQIKVHPKDSTLISARAPINIDGTLSKPEVGVDTGSLAVRGGAAVALGALLTPIGSLLAFIEPGLGENSQCAAFLHELDKKTGGAIPKNKS